MKTKIAIISGVIGFILLATPAFAQGTPSPFPTPRKAGLAQGALRSCMAREDAVKGRMQSLSNLAANIERVFDSIAAKVENFYTATVVPSGKTVSNYDVLVADIATKKGIVDTDLSTARSLVNSFSCSTDDPRALLTSFRADMQKVKADLKNYRTAIKNLIVAVRPLAPEASPEAKESEKPEGTEKPEASETPEPTPVSTPSL